MDAGKLSVQTIFNSPESMPSGPEEFSSCMGCGLNLFKGTIFGGDRDAVMWASHEMLNILHRDFIGAETIDNEQAGLSLLFSRFPQRFRILFPGNGFEQDCSFVCI